MHEEEERQEQRYGYLLYDPEGDQAFATTLLWSQEPPLGYQPPAKKLQSHTQPPVAALVVPVAALPRQPVVETSPAKPTGRTALQLRLEKRKRQLEKGGKS